jgi:hypothetical protein
VAGGPFTQESLLSRVIGWLRQVELSILPSQPVGMISCWPRRMRSGFEMLFHALASVSKQVTRNWATYLLYLAMSQIPVLNL